MLTTDSDRLTDELEDREFTGGCVGAQTADKELAGGGDACPNCHQSLPKGSATVCPHCGFYASLGVCVDLDQDWERLAGGQQPQPEEAAEEPSPTSHVEVWINLIPVWAWTLIGCNAAIVLLSIFARVAVPSGLPRSLWSVGQLLVGLIAFLACHCTAYLISIAEDASMNILDIVLKPFRLWKEVVRELPRRFALAAGGSCGVTAVAGAVLIIGSLPYGMLLDWGVKAPPQRNLVGAIVAHAREVEGDEDGLEQAVEDFAGRAGELTEEGINKLAGKTVEKNVRVDCVVVGYTVDKKDPRAISSLLVAREFQGRLKYVGRLVDGLTADHRYDLKEDLQEARRARSFVSVPPHVTAQWVQPKFVCRVKCLRETQSGSLVEMELDEMLGAIN